MLWNQWLPTWRAGARTVLLVAAMALGACSDRGSESAQSESQDLTLDQCEMGDGTVLGEPMDPITINGIEVQACLITAGHIAGGTRSALKYHHRYEPLVWVLDGTLEIGDNRTYATLAEFNDENLNGNSASLSITSDSTYWPAELGENVLRARAGSKIIVHRNGLFQGDVVSEDDNTEVQSYLVKVLDWFQGDVVSEDDNLDGSGEWGGIIVNSVGSHPDCPDDTSTSNFCNVEGEYGYYGGLSTADAQTAALGGSSDTVWGYNDYYANSALTRQGFIGSVSEAGGALSDGEPLPAAVVLNAPLSPNYYMRISAFDTAGTGIEINGGYVVNNGSWGLGLVTQNTQGSAVYWHNDFSGGFYGVFYHSQADQPALHGIGGDVDLAGITLIDRDFTGGTAISVQGGQVDLTNVLVQNFRACLQLDASAGATLTAVAFGCLEPTAAAEDGTDYAASVTAAALEDADSVYYEVSPELTTELRVGNSELNSAYANWTSSGSSGGRGAVSDSIDNYDLHDLRLIYPDCMGVGTLLAEDQTVTVNRTSYRLCELSGTIDNNVRLSGSFNDGYFAWVLDGEVSFGTDFASLSEAEQLAALESPGYLAISAGTPVYARAGASLTVQPGVQWIVDGNADYPVEIAAMPVADTAHWSGVRVNGIDSASCQSGSTTGVCAYAGSKQLSLKYLSVIQAGDGQPALTLHDLGPGTTINYLEISQSAGTGLLVDGGRVNLDHLVLTDNAGDQLSWQHGYRGTVQYGLISSGTPSTGHVLHGRNDETDADASPRSRPVLANLTMVNGGAELEGAAIRLAQGSGLLLYNSVVSGFVYCLDIDDAATAALQTSNPQQIAMFNVVLGCDATLALDDEDGGQDYGNAVAQSDTVYALDPQLDTDYLPANPALPATADSLDLSLAGEAAEYLDSDAGYWGAVEDADDDWYLGWNDLGVLLAAECDGKGVLVTDDYPYLFYRGRPLEDEGYSAYITFNYKICRLQNLLSEDLELTRYTGEDAAVDADGNVTKTEPGSKYGLSGEVTWTHPAVPTIWLLDGIVTVGDGARELADSADAELLKADPVELTMRPGTWVTATETGGLHVTRGGRLRILGEPMLMEEFCSAYTRDNGWCVEFATTGPVSMFGLPLGSGSGNWPMAEDGSPGDYAPYAPIGNVSWTTASYYNDYTLYSTSAWQGITVDGFARNNQCTDAATAESGSQVCNIAGTLGYHGGYDDGYETLEVHNLYMAGGLLQLNSVAGEIDGLRYQPPSSFLSEQTGEASVVSLDGGRVNIRELLIDLVDGYGGEWYNSAKPGSLIRWNHGYQGSLQYIYGFTTQVEDGQETRLQANGRDYFVPLIRGANGDAGHEDDEPRSMPTIANLSLVTRESPTSEIASSAIELTGGSGLYLYHAVMGAEEDYTSAVASDYCFKLDASVADRVTAGEFVASQLATTCSALSDNAAVPVETMTGVSNGYADSGTAVFSGYWSSAEQVYVDPYSSGADPLSIRVDYNRRYPVQAVVYDYGHVMLDTSSSPTAAPEFFEVTDYLGTLDYWLRPW